MEVRGRAIVSAILVVVGLALAMVACLIPSSADTTQAQGTVIDFDDYETVWTDADLEEFETAADLLAYACERNGYTLMVAEDGTIEGIDGHVSGEDGNAWGMWVVLPGTTGWVELPAPYDYDPSDYTVVSWAYRAEGEEPTVAVDAAGNPIYGFSQTYRLVTLSPTVTEIVTAIGGLNTIVGADYYSDYPASVQVGKDEGTITMVGTYTSPSFEVIVGTNPDMVLCDGSQYSHFQVAAQLRNVGINAIVLYEGSGLDSVLDNIFIAGQVMCYDIAADELIGDTGYVLDSLGAALEGHADGSLEVMVALEPDISPWVAGSQTYMDGILGTLSSENVFSDWSGWVHITSDMIMQQNPEVIIVITSEYAATQEEYDYLYSHLSAQWQYTDAWKEGRVYVVCESAAEMFQRFGPRTAQVAELMAMMLYPEAFDTEVPMIIGDDYAEYLQYSRSMNV